MSLFSRSTLLPECEGVRVSGPRDANEILVVGDIGRDDLGCAINHILFLVQDGRRLRCTFNTVAGYRIRVEENDSTLDKVLLLHIDPVEFALDLGLAYLFHDFHDEGWREVWEALRPDQARDFDKAKTYEWTKYFQSTDTFAGSRRKEGSVCEARNRKDGKARASPPGGGAEPGARGCCRASG